MNFTIKLLRLQLKFLNKFADSCSIRKSRYFQDKIGRLMSIDHQKDVIFMPIPSSKIQSEIIIPKHLNNNGIILYVHGGGYVSGGIEYAKGFGTILAVQNHIKVCCVAYRLAPENKFPAALDDAFDEYNNLLKEGYCPEQIVLCGESAGGGLIYSLMLKIKEENLPMPCGLIAISPWTDLTSSGKSYETNCKKDPSMTKKRLQFYAKNYTDNFLSPFVSPLNADFTGFPPSLIFVGGDEVMLSDSTELHSNLIKYNCQSQLHIAPDMWHIYLLYGLKVSKEDRKKIGIFLQEVLK